MTGHAGYTWDPVGIEIFGGFALDYTSPMATFDGNIAPGSNQALTGPARTESFRVLRAGGIGALRARVVIDGNCLSACTLVLGLVPNDRICATPRARFGFHAAWMPDPNGRPVTSPMGTQALWNIYPVSVRHWINRHGGLSRRMIFMEGRSLSGIVANCDRPTTRTQIRSERRYSSRPIRDIPASAASDRR